MLLTRRMEFSSSHRLWREDWSEARNRAVFGRGAAPISHGHNYELEVAIQGPVDGETGMVLDLGRLQDVMDAEIASRFDHRDLNDQSDCFGDRPPTAEHFAEVIFQLLDRALPSGMLSRVRLRPTLDYEAEVTR